jgi:hypothetical protein
MDRDRAPEAGQAGSVAPPGRPQPNKRLALIISMTTPFLQTIKTAGQSPGACQGACGGHNEGATDSASAVGRLKFTVRYIVQDQRRFVKDFYAMSSFRNW